MKLRWNDVLCNQTTHFENEGEQRRRSKKVTFLPKADAKLTFSVIVPKGEPDGTITDI